MDRGGSGWIRGGSWTFPPSKPSRNLGKRGRTAKGRRSCSRSNLCLYKIKRGGRGVSSATDLGTQGGGRAVAFLECYGPWFCSLRPDVLHRTDNTEPNQPTLAFRDRRFTWSIRPTDRPIDPTAGQPAGRPAGWPPARPTDRPVDRPTDQSIDRPSERASERPTDPTTDRPIDRASERSTDRPTDRLTD